MGRGRRRLLGGMRRDHNGKSLAAVRLAAERGVKHYIEHLDSVDDPRTLKLIRKNLEAKQSEMQWYDDQAFMEHNVELEAKLEKTRAIVKSLEKEVKEEKRENRRRSPLAALAVAGAIGAAAYLIAQRNEAPDDEDEIGEKYNYEDGGGAAHIENGAENGAEA